MILQNISIGVDVSVHETSSINNVIIGDRVKIAKRCSIFGSRNDPVVIGDNSYIGMNSVINGFAHAVIIGKHCSIAQNVNIMSDSGPNASDVMQKIFPIIREGVSIGDHAWIGASVIIMPGVTIGRFCVVAANSFVNISFDDYCIIGGTPAKLIRRLTEREINELTVG
ncbi:DapH/DapD/GlmU-related protein [Aeromonas rivipollensis]|uniref:acyltransferase n=1 Tax=Aeromonas rivipollensis TaxID=948519 RepID=UPI0038D8FA98